MHLSIVNFDIFVRFKKLNIKKLLRSRLIPPLPWITEMNQLKDFRALSTMLTNRSIRLRIFHLAREYGHIRDMERGLAWDERYGYELKQGWVTTEKDTCLGKGMATEDW